MQSQGVLWVDRHPGQNKYRQLKLPDNWERKQARKWGSIGQAMEWVLDQYPDASHYGWLSDDTYPRTPNWDQQLEQAAGNGNLSYAKDLWLSEDPEAREALIRGNGLSSGLCWAGDLVRAVGWWNLPGTRQAGIDTAWTAIVGKLRRGRYVESVVVEHKNWRTGKRRFDSSDEWVKQGRRYVEEDMRLRDVWLASRDYIDTLERVSKACPQQTEYEQAVIKLIETSWTRSRPQPNKPTPGNQTWEDLPMSRRQAHISRGGKPYDIVEGEARARP